MSGSESIRKYTDGRDEMNLADFPISALQRQQKDDGQGGKLDRMEFVASRYDPVSRHRLSQRVTLTTTAQDGLPTPADEHVILALLYVAKHGTNFVEATVPFAPGQLFDIMGWSPNGRSYDRLRCVLRRLKSLTVRYENAWWDAAGRGYEEEVATGIISGYRLARQVSGPRKPGAELQSWVTWTQQFHQSLRNGNIKRLDLDLFFRLSTPTAQRIYRFLDKRFYNSPMVAMDLVEFACGHVGLTENTNVAVLKRRLAPAIEELEKVGFLVAATAEERYQKVRPGIWRVQFQAMKKRIEADPAPAAASPVEDDATTLARAFYRQWDGNSVTQPGPKDLQQAQLLLDQHGPIEARELLILLVQVTRKEWPDCRSLSGAAQKYLNDAIKLRQQNQQREQARQHAEAARQQNREQEGDRQTRDKQLADAWSALTAEAQEEIRAKVLREQEGAPIPEAFLRRLCLRELESSRAGSVSDRSNSERL